RRRFLLAREMTRGVIHLLVSRPGIDQEQLVRQLDRAYGIGILLVQLHGIHKVPARVAPAGRVDYLRPAHAAFVGDVVIRLENPLELVQETRRPFTPAAHAEIEDRPAARSSVLPQVSLMVPAA